MNKYLQELGELMERSLTPGKFEARPNQSYIYVDGNHDCDVVVYRNGHCVGMISGFALAQVMDALKGRPHWIDGEPASFLAELN